MSSSDTGRIKMYFHVVYGGDRRRYGGTGRNYNIFSPHQILGLSLREIKAPSNFGPLFT